MFIHILSGDPRIFENFLFVVAAIKKFFFLVAAERYTHFRGSSHACTHASTGPVRKAFKSKKLIGRERSPRGLLTVLLTNELRALKS